MKKERHPVFWLILFLLLLVLALGVLFLIRGLQMGPDASFYSQGIPA